MAFLCSSENRLYYDVALPSILHGSAMRPPSRRTHFLTSFATKTYCHCCGGFIATPKFRRAETIEEMKNKPAGSMTCEPLRIFSTIELCFRQAQKIDKHLIRWEWGISVVVEKCLIRLCFDNGSLLKAYQKAQLSTNIRSSGVLEGQYDICFKRDSPVENAIRTCIETKEYERELFLKFSNFDVIFAVWKVKI